MKLNADSLKRKVKNLIKKKHWFCSDKIINF